MVAKLDGARLISDITSRGHIHGAAGKVQRPEYTDPARQASTVQKAD
jgi:hypothetical protein